MADIIDAFVVTLGLDPTAYNRQIREFRDTQKRLRDQEAKDTRAQEDGQKRLLFGMKELRNETAGFLFMLAGANGIKDFVSNIVSGDAATGRLAANMGMATRNLAVWQAALGQVGGTAQDATQALQTLTTLYQNYQLGQANPQQLAGMQGLGITDISDPEKVLMKMAAASQRMSRPEFTARMSMLGINQNMTTLLAQGPGKVGGILEEMRKIGVTTDEDAKAAQAFDAALNKIGVSLKSVFRPEIEKVGGATATWLGDQKNLNLAMDAGAGLLGAFAVAAVAASWEILLVAGAITAVIGAYRELKAQTPEALAKDKKDRLQKAQLTPDQAKQIYGAFGGGGDGEERFNGALRWVADRAVDAWGYVTGSGGAPSSSSAPPANAKTLQTGGGGKAVALDGNNPGGIMDGQFARSQPGYVGANGKFAAFSSLAAGEAAQQALLRSYVRRGIDTPLAIARRWAPRKDGNNPESYAAGIASRMGIGVNDRITPQAINAFQRSQAFGENAAYGKLRGMTASPRAGGGSVNQTTTVGTIVINTAATYANEIARDIRGAMAKRGLVVQANPGLQ